MVIRFFISFFFLLNVSLLTAQNIKFKTYLTEDGLSNNSITSIVVDSESSLWLSTWDGVNFYDGHAFISYKHNPNDSTSISGNYIYNSVKDKNNRIWFLTDSKHLSLLQKDRSFKNFEFSEKPTQIGLNSAGQLLALVKDEAFIFNGKGFVKCNNCKINRGDEYWETLLAQYFPDVSINVTLKDRQGNIWLGTFKDGLLYIPANKIPTLKKTDIQQYRKDVYDDFSLSSNEIDALAEDDFGNIWIGTKDGGIQRAYPNSEQIFYVSQHPEKQPYLSTETIRAINVNNGTTWLGYYTKGIFKKTENDQVFKPYPLKENLDWNRIRALYTSSDGSLFGGTYAGIFRAKENKVNYYTAEETPNFVNNRNYAFYENKHQQVYVGCWGGVSLFDLNKSMFIPFQNQALLNDFNVRDLIEINGILYIATEKNGVIKFDGKKVTSITIEKGILDNSVYSLWYEESSRQLWVGTLGGISIYNIATQKVIKNLNEENGLQSHLVYGILGTEDYIWCSTTKGLATIDKNTFEVYPHPAEEGFQSKEFSEGAYFKDKKEMLYFGGVNGLNFFNSTKIDLKEELPIIKLFIDGKEYRNDFEKPFSQNKITFTIDPTFYGVQKKNKIYYKLEGIDEDWKEKDYSFQEITYESLPAGEFVFQVKNSLDEKSNIVSSKIIIQKPFWQTLTFYLFIGILLFASLFLLYYFRRRAQQKRELILEEKIQERVATISEQKKNIADMNALLLSKNKEITIQQEELQKMHAKIKTETMELKKFSSFIVNEYKKPLSKISESLNNPDYNKHYVQKDVNELMNKVLEWDYLGQINLDDELENTAVELEQFSGNLIKELIQKSEEKKIAYTIKQETQPLWVNIDVLKFKLLLNYIVTDVFKYRENDFKLDLEYKITPESVFFQIKSGHKLLLENLYNIIHYSPYHQASKTLATLLKIDFQAKKEDNESVFRLAFKPEVINPEKKIEVSMSWIHAGIIEDLDSNKHNILVWAKPHMRHISKLMPDSYNVIFESDADLLFSVLKTVKIQIMVIYNLKIAETLLTVLHNLKNKYPLVKIMYVSENINYELEQHIIELGMDSSVQLPINKKILEHKLSQITNIRGIQLQREENVYNVLENILNIENPNSDEKLIHQAFSIIEEKMSNVDFNVTELYESLGISKIKCYRVFKDVLDIPPSEFILNLKMKKAKTLLTKTNLNVAEVAYETGFSDPKYFSKVFKKQEGMSPKKFKNKQANIN